MVNTELSLIAAEHTPHAHPRDRGARVPRSWGEVVWSPAWQATYNGKHNRVKLKAFLLMAHLLPRTGWTGNHIGFWTVFELDSFRVPGVSYLYLSTRLPLFKKWKYVVRKRCVVNSRKAYCYRITTHALKWLDRVPEDVMGLADKEVRDGLARGDIYPPRRKQWAL